MVDRLVAQVPSGPVGVLGAQLIADLLRTPGVLKFRLHQVTQLAIADEDAGSLPPLVVAGTSMREVRVVEAVIVRFKVPAQLAGHGRRRAADPTGDLRTPSPRSRRVAIRCRSSSER